MGIFTKMFGPKDSADKTVAEARGVDFFTALSLHLRGELDPALGAYLTIAAELPDYNLAPFFASAILAGTENTAEAADRLRGLSRRIAAGGETISRTITRDLFALMESEPTLKVPALAEVIVNFGDRLKQEGFVQESAVCFEIAVGLLPDHASVLHRLGDTLHDLGVYDYAESVLRKALEYAPNHWDSLYTYAVLLQDLGRFDEAIGCYDKAVTLYPDHAKCRNNYGAALLLTGRLDEALVHCTAAAELDPGLPLARVNLGNIHLLKQEYDTARNCFNDAISLDGNLAPAYFGLGSVEQSTGGDIARVRELYRRAIELSPSTPQFHHAMGNLLADEGDQEALAHFAAAARVHDSLKDLQRDFGNACLRLGQREEGLEHLRIALEQNPDDDMARKLLARAGGENQSDS